MLLVWITIRVFLRLVNGSSDVIRSCVNRVHLERLVSFIYDVMPFTSGNENCPVVLYFLVYVETSLRITDHNACLALFEAKELIMVIMHLSADFSTSGDAHYCHLEVLASPQGIAEVLILLSNFLGIQHVGVRAMIRE